MTVRRSLEPRQISWRDARRSGDRAIPCPCSAQRFESSQVFDEAGLVFARDVGEAQAEARQGELAGLESELQQEDEKIRADRKVHEDERDRLTADRAAVWIAPITKEGVCCALEVIHEKKVPLLVLGRGSNLLVSDYGWEGATLYLGENFSGWRFDDRQAKVQAGTLLMDLIRAAVSNGLSGLELLAGIPGGVGGALCMNAGAFGQEIAPIEYRDRRETKMLTADEGIRGGRMKGYKANAEELMTTLRVDYAGLPGTRLGFSYSMTNAVRSDADPIGVNLFEFHAQHQSNNIYSVFEVGNIL